jgi:hypothetical protein
MKNIKFLILRFIWKIKLKKIQREIKREEARENLESH